MVPKAPDGPVAASTLDDYLNLPQGVRPTTFEVLEQGTDLLFIRHMRYKEVLTSKQRQICNRLLLFGAHPDAPGSTSVLCVWGITSTARFIETFEPHGHEGPRPVTTDEVRKWIADWFDIRRGRR